MSEKKNSFKVSDFMNKAETDTKVYTFYGPKQLVTNDVFVITAMRSFDNVSDGEHVYNGVKVDVRTK